MKSITVKFEFHDLEGYEDADDELIIEDHLRGCRFDDVGFEVIPDWISVKDRLCPRGSRILVYAPELDETMRIRIIDSKFLKICSDVTHWMWLPHRPGDNHDC